MASCPKCGYERRREDDDFVPRSECPKCGIIYEKFLILQERPKEKKNPNHTGYKTGGRSRLLGVIVCVLGIIFARPIFNYIEKRHANSSHNTTNRISNIPIRNNGNNIPDPREPIYDRYPPITNSQVPNKPLEHHNKSGRDIEYTINTLLQSFDKPLTQLDVFTNKFIPYQWETIRQYKNYSRISGILDSYRRQHTYMKNELFVCADMAIDIWNLLTTEKIESKIMAGNVQIDILSGSTLKTYLTNINHVWLLAQISPSFWIPLETTGGHIVQPSMLNFHLYNTGVMFDNPKQYKDFDANRKAMFASMNEAASLVDHFNELYGGKPTTPEATEYMGRMKQKLDDCERLVSKVTASLQRR